MSKIGGVKNSVLRNWCTDLVSAFGTQKITRGTKLGKLLSVQFGIQIWENNLGLWASVGVFGDMLATYSRFPQNSVCLCDISLLPRARKKTTSQLMMTLRKRYKTASTDTTVEQQHQTPAVMASNQNTSSKQSSDPPSAPVAVAPAGGAAGGTLNGDALSAFRGERKCYLRSCRLGRTQSAMYTCFHAECERPVHWECYKAFVLRKNGLEHFHPDDSLFHVVCTKKHYETSLKVVKEADGTSIPWNKDGPDISNPTINSSLSILLDWFTTQGNYDRYRGDDRTGKTKKIMCQELSARMLAAGCRKERTDSSVFSKIDQFVKQHKKAYDWSKGTGEGVLEKHGRQTFNEILLSYCPYWFELNPILGDRAATRPDVNSDDLLETIGEEEAEE